MPVHFLFLSFNYHYLLLSIWQKIWLFLFCLALSSSDNIGFLEDILKAYKENSAAELKQEVNKIKTCHIFLTDSEVGVQLFTLLHVLWVAGDLFCQRSNIFWRFQTYTKPPRARWNKLWKLLLYSTQILFDICFFLFRMVFCMRWARQRKLIPPR